MEHYTGKTTLSEVDRIAAQMSARIESSMSQQNDKERLYDKLKTMNDEDVRIDEIDANREVKVLEDIAETCSKGKHIVLIQGKQGMGKTTIAKRVLARLSNQPTAYKCLMLADNITEDEQLYNIINMFYGVDDGVLIITDFTNQPEEFVERIKRVFNVAGYSHKDIMDRVDLTKSLTLHVTNCKIDSYLNYAKYTPMIEEAFRKKGFIK